MYAECESVRVCMNECVESEVDPQTLDPWSIYRPRIRVRGCVPGSWSYTCRGLILYTCPGVGVEVVFWNVPWLVSIASS